MGTQPTPQTSKPDLSLIVSDVLGDLAFLIADDETPEISPGTIWLQGEVGYTGPQQGKLQCWCTREFAIQLAANLLGTDPADPEALTDAEDALRELLNVLCGNLVTSWHGDTAVFNLGIPQVKECFETPTPADGDQKNCCRLSVSGEPVFFLHEVA
jgi:CheY-specific phosphatase CheX